MECAEMSLGTAVPVLEIVAAAPDVFSSISGHHKEKC